MTLKQQLLPQKIIENHGNLGKAMLEVGYAPNTAKNPKRNVMKSKTWPEIMEKYLPDNFLASKHKELLTVPRKVKTYMKGDLVSETEEVDSQALGVGLNLAYKIKNKYPANAVDVSGTIAVVKVVKFTDDKVIEAETVDAS